MKNKIILKTPQMLLAYSLSELVAVYKAAGFEKCERRTLWRALKEYCPDEYIIKGTVGIVTEKGRQFLDKWVEIQIRQDMKRKQKLVVTG